jgi:pimeloyl-ACP methyl ester carboxylesterase
MTDAPLPKNIGCFDEGEGKPVILLHASLSSKRQWRKLQQFLGGRYRLLGLDLLGYGDTPPPQADGFTFAQEVDLVERLLERVEGPVHLAGHSYGGVVALKTALRHPGRVQSIYAHEPVVFALLKQEGRLAEWREIETVRVHAAEHLRKGNPEQAAEEFIDYWSGAGAWQKIPDDRRQVFVQAMPKLMIEFAAISGDTDRLSDYQRLNMPVALTAGDTGAQTGRCVAELLSGALPQGSLHIVEGAGHMAPVADADRINAIIAEHLAKHAIDR